MRQQPLLDADPTGSIGDDLDFYETPADAVHAVCDVLPERLRTGPVHLVDPGCGRGAIFLAAAARLTLAHLTAIELHAGRYEEARRRATALPGNVVHQDFLSAPCARYVADQQRAHRDLPVLVLGNPPYSAPRQTIGLEFVEAALRLHGDDDMDRVVAMLLPLDFATGKARCERVHDRYDSSLYPLRRRPYFGGPHSGGQRPYAWFVWDLREPRREWRVIG